MERYISNLPRRDPVHPMNSPTTRVLRLILSLAAVAFLPVVPSLIGQSEDAPDGGRFQLPATGQSVKNQVMFLALDDRSLPFRDHLVCYPSKPEVRQEPVLTPSKDNRD